MSAFICSIPHITTIIKHAKGVIPDGILCVHHNGKSYDFHVRTSMVDIIMVGQELLNENYKSVNYRYREDEKPPQFKPDMSVQSVGTDQALHLISSLEYQSCEHDGWDDSLAKRILETIKSYSIKAKIPSTGEKVWVL